MKTAAFFLVVFAVACGSTSPTSPEGGISPSSPQVAGLVTFSFDDNRTCVYQAAIPILDSAGLKSTNYVITQRLINSEDYMGASEVLNLEARGHEVGSHTRTHADLTTLSLPTPESQV